MILMYTNKRMISNVHSLFLMIAEALYTSRLYRWSLLLLLVESLLKGSFIDLKRRKHEERHLAVN